MTRFSRWWLAGTCTAALAGATIPSVAAWRDGDLRHTPAALAQSAGRTVYLDTCSRCHGPAGNDGKAPSLVPFRWNYDQALDVVRHGGACGMPAFSESELSDEAVKQIVDYMKTLK